jgi:hypothetical protein
MPKKPSGAFYKQRRNQLAELSRVQEAQRRSSAPKDENPLINDYRRIGEPPLGDPTKALLFATDCLVTALGQVAVDPIIDAAARWRTIAEIARALGQCHSKAVVMSKLETLGLLEGDRADDDPNGLQPNPLALGEAAYPDADDGDPP